MSTERGRRRTRLLARAVGQSLASLILLSVILRAFVISSYVMAGSSMLPSLWPGDFLFGTRYDRNGLRRGDVVALRCPQARDAVCLKRVIGLPGDRIEFRAGHLHINERGVETTPLGKNFKQETFEDARWPVWTQAAAPVSDAEPLVVPPQSVYLLNDKRGDVDDSRSWGPVSSELLEARASRVWLSLDWSEATGRVRSFPRVRWDRMFHAIN